MKAVFEYDNGKKYHADVQYFEILGKQLVVYVEKLGKWIDGHRKDIKHTIDVQRSGLVSITVKNTVPPNCFTVPSETKHIFKQQPKQKIKTGMFHHVLCHNNRQLIPEALEKAVKKGNKVVRYTHPNVSVCWFIQGDDIYAESKRGGGGSWLTNSYTVESLQEAVESGELVVYDEHN